MNFKSGHLKSVVLVQIYIYIYIKFSREVASVFLLPSCCSFWFPVRETGGFFKGWPRFIPVYQFAIAALTLQGALLTHSLSSWLRRLCCAAWKTALEYQWMFFFLYQLSLSFYLPSSLSLLLHLHPDFFPPHFLIALIASPSTCFCPSSFPILSRSVSFCVCLSPSLPLSLFDLRAVSSSSSRSELCSHLSHHWGEETSFIDAAPFSLFVGLTVTGHLVFALFTTVVPAVLNLSGFS